MNGSGLREGSHDRARGTIDGTGERLADAADGRYAEEVVRQPMQARQCAVHEAFGDRSIALARSRADAESRCAAASRSTRRAGQIDSCDVASEVAAGDCIDRWPARFDKR
ncbi:hypothetical protein WS70_21500 [Burkholderia mayonis]|uniref:Uncharacterized protein n=1 Tax=Burkholderia mayonis TaxID=1385591 RepID=A0A1B4FL80_9BURK|nr:hypothetical protein WS70_21500 [Burkholderia mayonis]KVE41185.1 hypothetical protein WS70_15470 [Burkholderia mayonis]